MSFKPEVIAAIITAISAIIVGILNSPAVGKIINFPQSYIITPTLMPSESFYREDVIYPNEYSDTDLAGNQIYMKLVPSGKFLLGSKFGIHDGNLVQEVNLSAFYIDVYEVTNTLYQACVSAGACLPPTGVESYSRNSYYQSIDFVDYPVVNVNWYMAQSYCEWRGMQLPTEPQWEKAARGGLQGKSYPWGESMPVCEKGVENGAKFDDNVRCNGTDTEIVGNYFSNGFGLYDMAGNVWEWTRSLYKPYPYVAKDGRENMELIDPRVLRGGSWRNAQYLQRVSFRNKAHPDLASNMVGFRCVRLLP
jgi:formylglycine-generating enzyme required for sulfatase activity